MLHDYLVWKQPYFPYIIYLATLYWWCLNLLPNIAQVDLEGLVSKFLFLKHASHHKGWKPVFTNGSVSCWHRPWSSFPWLPRCGSLPPDATVFTAALSVCALCALYKWEGMFIQTPLTLYHHNYYSTVLCTVYMLNFMSQTWPPYDFLLVSRSCVCGGKWARWWSV